MMKRRLLTQLVIAATLGLTSLSVLAQASAAPVKASLRLKWLPQALSLIHI